MKHFFLGAVIGVIVIFAAAVATKLDDVCMPTPTAHQILANEYAESRVATGLIDESTAFELFANAESGSWTMLHTKSSGTSCVMQVGDTYIWSAPAWLDPSY